MLVRIQNRQVGRVVRGLAITRLDDRSVVEVLLVGSDAGVHAQSKLGLLEVLDRAGQVSASGARGDVGPKSSNRPLHGRIDSSRVAMGT